ncbi:CaiB/BaiF CoA transferase family protein [Noviherbaspirillum sp. Root189]|uniref:CaiB/BaiF CoA transferase family protein n=1 Tax=Noviherbaspirillum sp. Root189 TaxID=1736487 RepID=UPI0007101EC3|nr:CoA transferase [Noviherbaspirillum sp. Root189]KRB81059.1 CoA-transferase [Noviherbaspirillum sp. Root189]
MRSSEKNTHKDIDKRPLAGIRVLDMTRVFSGPWGTQILGDLGADVIKIEQPGRGDDQRRLGPPFLLDRSGQKTSESSYYLSVNRNKRSVALDIKTLEGQEAIKKLAEKSDVFIENFKVGNLAKYGLDYENLASINPRIIYCSISGFGQTGPRSQQMGYDTAIQAMCGVMSVTGKPDEEQGGEPLKVGLVLSDMMAGTYAAMAIQAALYARDTREDALGQYIDISMFDAQLAAMSHQASHYLVSGQIPGRFGNGAPSVSPSNAFRCMDGKIVIVAGNDDQFRRLCNVLDLLELVEDERYLSNSMRVVNRHSLHKIIEDKLRINTKTYWLKILEEAHLVAAPINTLDEALADPQAHAREIVRHVEHISGGTVPLVTSPMRLSRTPLDRYAAPPTCGQHTAEVLEELLGISR